MPRKVLVLAETRDGEFRKVTFEAIAAAAQVAAGGEVVVAVFGENVEGQESALIQHGANRVVVAEHSDLKEYTTDAYFQAFMQVLDRENPEGLIIGHTALGKDLAPRIASKLNIGLISDAIGVEVDGETPVFIRPIYSGKAFEKRAIEGGIIFATIRPNNIPALEPDTARSGDIQRISVELKDLRTVIKEVVRKATTGVDLSEAKVVVAGGRGVKSADGFKPLEELAQLLGGAVGASRGACDAEYCDYSLQIGQTGKVVTPDLYFAVGISGAIQHLAGMSSSKIIVAINKDPEAPIFEVADYGIVGDLFEVIPLLTDELKKVLLSNV